jgi:hypothetical protein
MAASGDGVVDAGTEKNKGSGLAFCMARYDPTNKT